MIELDDLLTAAKGQIQQRVQQRGQQRLDTYGLGIALVSVSLQSVDPPGEALVKKCETLARSAVRTQELETVGSIRVISAQAK